MPTAVEDALKKAAAGYVKKHGGKKKKGDALDKAKAAFVYGTMTRMQERGSIAPWRTIKHPTKK